MCLVRSGREGGRNCREDLLAGGQPPIRPNGGEKRAASFPRPVTKRLRVRSMLMRLLKLAAHTRTRRCTACNLPRWNTIETIPVILAFPTCLQPCVPCIQQNGKRANGFEREKDREREICRRSDCESKGEGKSILASRHAKHRLANYSRSLARIAWPFHPREPS